MILAQGPGGLSLSLSYERYPEEYVRDDSEGTGSGPPPWDAFPRLGRQVQLSRHHTSALAARQMRKDTSSDRPPESWAMGEWDG